MMLNIINRMFCMPFIFAIVLCGTPILVMADFMGNVKSTLGGFRKTIEDTVKTKDKVKRVTGQVLDNEKTLSAKMQSPLTSDGQLEEYQPSLFKLSSIDLLAPAGISIGMPMKKAKAKLAEAGYKNFRIEYDRSRIFVNIKAFAGAPHVQTIDFVHEGFDMESTPTEIIARATKRIGIKPECTFFDQRNAICTWIWPPNDPYVKNVRLTIKDKSFKIKEMAGRGSEFSLLVTGVNDLEEKLATGSTNESPSLGIGDTIDPLKPEGIAIGMSLKEVELTLKHNSFRKKSRCEFIAERSGGQITFKIVSADSGHGCPDEKAIRTIKYAAYNIKVSNSVLDIVTRMNQRLGSEPTACKGLTEFGASCFWDLPPAAPLIKRVYLQTSKTDLTLDIKAVDNLGALVTVVNPPSTVEMNWWERELSAKKETPVEFRNSDTNLTPDELNKIRDEAKKVYKYCNGRQLFSSFHDCGCVAQQFSSKRVEEITEWQIEDSANQTDLQSSANDSMAVKREKFAQQRRQRRLKAFLSGNVNVNNLIAIADKVADKCPNKAGAAHYAYRQCISQYEIRLQDNLEVFCICYADRFSNLYMQDSNASMPTITRTASAALKACSKEISPNPLNI